jgi:hypothetical protein
MTSIMACICSTNAVGNAWCRLHFGVCQSVLCLQFAPFTNEQTVGATRMATHGMFSHHCISHVCSHDSGCLQGQLLPYVLHAVWVVTFLFCKGTLRPTHF